MLGGAIPAKWRRSRSTRRSSGRGSSGTTLTSSWIRSKSRPSSSARTGYRSPPSGVSPAIAAENSLEFCLIDEESGACVATDRWEVVPSESDENLSFVFENLEAAIPHNVVITLLEGSAADPRPGMVLAESTLINGIASDYFIAEDLTWDDLPEEWYFFCRVHANMNGVGTVVRAEG